VGDLMVASISADGTVNSTPSGWSSLTSQETGGGGGLTQRIYYITATSTEVAASNFTWTTSSSNVFVGWIARITGHHSTNPMGVNNKEGVASSASPTYSITVTPNNASSLLLFCEASYLTSATTSTWTSSTYAIVTSNPSWTEAVDTTIGYASGGAQTALAYATRPEVTATGNASLALSLSRESSGIMIVVRPAYSSSTTETVTTTDTVNKGLTKTFLETVISTDSTTNTKQKDWTNPSKNTTTWTNPNKS
jgi:hypothetical protein